MSKHKGSRVFSHNVDSVLTKKIKNRAASSVDLVRNPVRKISPLLTLSAVFLTIAGFGFIALGISLLFSQTRISK